MLQPDWRIEKIEFTRLPGERWRLAGCNARRGVHGKSVPLPLVRVTIAGETGFGWSRITREQAEAMVGTPVTAIFNEDARVRKEFDQLDFPLLDWLGKITNKPVYQLVARDGLDSGCPFSVRCYDTSLYFDDLHLEDDQAAVELIQAEADDGFSRGHRHFKIKVGRGARYMPLEAGMNRDISIIRGVRQTAGENAHIMIDANNGYNLSLTKQVLVETAPAHLYWVEEPFHEGYEYYFDLREWMEKEKINTMIADGEGLAAPLLENWASRGVIDVIQYDICDYRLSRWVELGQKLDQARVKSAPHNYGSPFGNYATGHLAAAIEGFQFVEWDEVSVQGLDASAYQIQDGKLLVPAKPGFGLNLDEPYFLQKVKEVGWIAD